MRSPCWHVPDQRSGRLTLPTTCCPHMQPGPALPATAPHQRPRICSHFCVPYICPYLVTASCSQGQFFQSLYQTKAKRPVGLNSEQLQVGWLGVGVVCCMMYSRAFHSNTAEQQAVSSCRWVWLLVGVARCPCEHARGDSALLSNHSSTVYISIDSLTPVCVRRSAPRRWCSRPAAR